MNVGTVSDYRLERFVLGELPPEEAVEIERAAAADSDIRAALDRLASSNRDILARYSAPAFKARLLARLGDAEDAAPGRPGRLNFLAAPAFRWKRPLAIVSASAAFVLAAALIIPGLRGRRGAPAFDAGGGETLVKGETAVDLARTQLLVYRKHGDLVEALGDGNAAAAGSLLQLGYVSAADPHGVILSIDGRGRVTRHFPAGEAGSTRLVRRRKSLLPNAIELDDAPGFERFFLITSARPIDVGAVLAKAGGLAGNPAAALRSDLDLPPGLNQESVLILKEGGAR